MTRLARTSAVLAAALAIALSAPDSSFAQYLYLDADGDGIHTAADVLQPTGATTFDVWLVTNRDRTGTLVDCSAMPGTDLTILSYEYILHATNGTVTYGAPVNRRPEFTLDFGTASDAVDLHAGFGGSSAMLPGAYRLATIVVTPATGTPALEFAPTTPLRAAYFTAFGSECPGADFDYTLKLGTDWFDSDGAAYGGAANHAPTLAPLSDVTVPEGTMLDVGLAATDLDGQSLSFSLFSGPSYAMVTTTDPGSGTATGNVHLAPGYADAGAADVMVSVTDGLATAKDLFTVTVPNVNRAPVLNQPSDMMPTEGSTLLQMVSASDADATALTFYKAAGPDWMTIMTTDPTIARGMITLSPPMGSMGMMTATLGVTDGDLSDTKDFMITVRVPNQSPMLRMPGNMFGEEGELMAFTVMAMDADGDPVSITAMGVPMGATFTDLGGGDATFRWVPGFDQAGAYPLTVTAADDKGGSETETMGIFVTEATRAVALAQPLDMSAPEGGTAEQMLRGYDASGDPLTFEKVAGPAYLSVMTMMPGAGFAQGRARIAPGFGDAGTTVATVAVTDGILRHERMFGITVGDAGAGPRHGEPPFVPPFPVLSVGMTPHTVTMGDLNGDGNLDLAVANMNSANVSVFLGDGDGTFGMRQNYMTRMMPHTVAIADLDRDGKPDLAVSNMGDNSIGTMLGKGDGTFMMMRTFPMTGSPMILKLGDLDRDGILDMAVSNQSGNTMVVMRGAGDGTFTQIGEYPAGMHPHGLVLGDMDHDGDLDVVMANDVSLTVSVYRNRGNGTFDRLPDFTTSAPHYLDAGDWNGDGQMDVAIANLSKGTVSVCLGGGDGTFTEKVEMMTGAGAHGVHAEDLDGDGLQDLIVSNQVANTLSVFMGRGDGTFAPKVDFMANGGAHSIASGDLDNDGDPDVVVSGINSNTEIVLMNQRPAVLPARAFSAGGDRSIRLMAEARPWTVNVEPVAGGFQASDVLPQSLVLISTGTGSIARVPAIAGKPRAIGDTDRNGIQDLPVSFAIADLRLLFDQLRGHRTVTATLQGDLVTGGRFRTEITLTLMNMPPAKEAAVTVAPNPLNPEATIRFETARPGAVRVRIYDAQGRLVRTLRDDPAATAGAHALRFDGLDARGARLGSGVYFFRVETPGGVTSGRFAILK